MKAHENKDIELLGLSFNANYMLREEGLKTIDDLAKQENDEKLKQENDKKLKKAISKMDVPIHPEEIRLRAEVNKSRYDRRDEGALESKLLFKPGTSEEDSLKKGVRQSA